MSIAAIVVTRNRRDLLRECLQRILQGSVIPDAVYVVNNQSQDGTADMLTKLSQKYAQLQVLDLDTNQGGAGGFHIGLQTAFAEGHGWFWLMDDDCMVATDSLETLWQAVTLHNARDTRPPVQLAASVADWQDGLPHTMNYPALRFSSRQDRERFYRLAAHGHLLIKQCTFVSVLIGRTAVQTCGLPTADYFIWVDDIAYTQRICHHFTGIVVAHSRVRHQTPSLHSALDAKPDKFYYAVRNTIWTLRLNRFVPAWDRQVAWLMHWLTVGRYLRKHPFSPPAWRSVIRGHWDALRHRPRMVTSLPDATTSREQLPPDVAGDDRSHAKNQGQRSAMRSIGSSAKGDSASRSECERP